MSKKFFAIVQARMGSTRLPGKVLLPIDDQSMLYHVVRQIKYSKFIKDVIIVTTNSVEDDLIIDFCKKYNVKFFRGSSDDVLDRYYQCAKKFQADPVLRISSDCPLIDPEIIDKVIIKFSKNTYDYVGSNVMKILSKWENSTCNFPQGMAIEISTFKALEKAWKESKKPSEREHVFPYIQSNPQLFRISNVVNRSNLSYIRCTVDREEDLRFVREIYKRVNKKMAIHVRDIVKIVKKEPALLEINNNILFDEGYRKSLAEDAKKGFK